MGACACVCVCVCLRVCMCACLPIPECVRVCRLCMFVALEYVLQDVSHCVDGGGGGVGVYSHG